MKLILSACILFFLVGTASARIEETLDQCVIRYGEPISKDGDIRVFSKSGFHITITFQDRMAECVVYRKIRHGGVSNGTISMSEISVLLQTTSAGKKWGVTASDGAGSPLKWKSEDGKFMAQLIPLEEFVVMTSSYFKRVVERDGDLEKKKLSGF